MRAIAKRKANLDNALKKGFATVYNQCSLEVRDKLEASNDWDKTQREQSLHELISKIERICVGFDNYKQEVFNLVQALKTLFLYTQGEKEGVDKYACNFKSLWDTVEAFRGSPGLHKGLVKGLLATPGRVASPSSITATEVAVAKEEVADRVKAALLISGADKQRYGGLKDQLGNNYLLGTDQYPDTLEKASKILGNYQITKGSPFGDRRNVNRGGRLAFIQQGRRTGRGRGGLGPGQGTQGANRGAGDTAEGVGDGASMGGSTLSSVGMQVSSAGESHCYHCGGEGHWASKCPELAVEQQAQLHMMVEGGEGNEPEEETAHQFFHVTMVQGKELPEWRAYLDGCLTVTAFKSKKHLKNVRAMDCRVKIHCNAGNLKTNQQGDYGTVMRTRQANYCYKRSLELWVLL